MSAVGLLAVAVMSRTCAGVEFAVISSALFQLHSIVAFAALVCVALTLPSTSSAVSKKSRHPSSRNSEPKPVRPAPILRLSENISFIMMNRVEWQLSGECAGSSLHSRIYDNARS